MIEMGCGYRTKNEIKTKRSKSETIVFNSETLLVIKLPNSYVLRVMSRSLFLAMLILALPSIGSILRGPSTSLYDYEAIGSHSIDFDLFPLLLRDLFDEGLIKKGNRGLILRSRVENLMDCLEFLIEKEIDLGIESDLDNQILIPDESLDFVLTFNSKVVFESLDRVLKIGGLLVMQLSNDPSNAFQQQSNYKIVYVRRFNSTVIAMRKTGLIENYVNSPRKIQKCGNNVESKNEAVKGLEDVLLEPPTLAFSSNEYLKKTKFLPDLLGDSLESYRHRIFITDDNGGGVQWFHLNYPTRNQYFEVYNLEVEVYDEFSLRRGMMMKRNGLSDWLMTNVRENEDFVVMKAEAQVVEEMMIERTICLVDELFLECKNKWEDNWEEANKGSGRRAYWECLALYGRLRDEGVVVHQWWG